MKLLAIDTSTDACSVGLMIDDQVHVDHRVVPQQHSALVLPMVDALLASAGLDVGMLDALVYGRGPGSFTGVRIGVASAQGIALGADIGVIGISTLHSIAQGCYRQYAAEQIAVSVDARMDEVYFCEYQLDEKQIMQAVSNEQIVPPAAVAAKLSAYWAGSGAERYAQQLQRSLGVDALHIHQGCLPHATDLLTLGAVEYGLNNAQAAEQAAPVYLRNKVAFTTAERDSRKTL